MYEWLPDVCRELKGNIVHLYWVLIVPYAIFTIILEYFNIDRSEYPNVLNVIKRVVLSIILLISFDECLHVVAELTEGLVEKIGGITNLKIVLDEISKKNEEITLNWIKLKEFIIFTLNLLSYMVAYLGIFVANALIHFIWSILYIVSPLMILMFVNERTSYITSNLYRGILSVAVWKVLWAILSVLLLKFITSNNLTSDTGDNFMTTILINFFIGVSMLFVPITAKSLINDGFDSLGHHYAQISSSAISQTVKKFTTNVTKGTLNRGWTGTKNLGGRAFNVVKERMKPKSTKT
ncbi:MAG: hypothetical protein HQK51_05575 [Oligoflexia bacterium]|nr:hypothetical protein [Oligoflexia bacterium]